MVTQRAKYIMLYGDIPVVFPLELPHDHFCYFGFNPDDILSAGYVDIITEDGVMAVYVSGYSMKLNKSVREGDAEIIRDKLMLK